MSEKENLLILTSSGGGGGIQGAKAKMQEAKKRNSKTFVLIEDLMEHNFVGFLGTLLWNHAQRSGRVFLQKTLACFQTFAEVLFWPFIYYPTLKLLREHDIDRVIDAQPLGTEAIIQAVKKYCQESGKKIFLEKFFVDLPTPVCTHFFRGIKKLTQEDRKWVKIVTIEPFLEKGESEEDFWQKHCKISLEQVIYEKYPIRENFKKYFEKKKEHFEEELRICAQSQDEADFLEKIFQAEGLERWERKNFEFSFATEGVFILTVLLGSQPAKDATYQYVKNFASLAKEYPEKMFYFFAFCSKDLSGAGLFQKFYELTLKNFPKNLKIIPFSFQEDKEVAPLFFRSDVTITRSGGQTAMELLAVSKGKVLVHSEAKSVKTLMKGMPFWEAGNARYLQKALAGEVVTPKTFLKFIIFK